MGAVSRMLPPYMVKSQLKIFTPVGIAMIMVAMPKNAFTFAPAPMVKKWWSHTMNESTQIPMVAKTMERYPNNGLPENVAITSEKTPKAGKIRMYTSGCPHAQMRLTYIMGLPPPSFVKKWNPRYRSRSNMAKVAVSIGNAATMRRFEASAVQQNTGMRP